MFLNVGEDLRSRRLQVGHIRVFINYWKRVEGELVGAPVTQPIERLGYVLICDRIGYSV